MHQISGSPGDPAGGGAYSAPPDPLAGFRRRAPRERDGEMDGKGEREGGGERGRGTCSMVQRA